MYFDLNRSKDRNYVLGKVEVNYKYFDFADDSLKDDLGTVFDAVLIDHRTFQYADSWIKSNKHFINELLSECADIYKYIDHSLKNDRELLLEAVSINGLNLQYANYKYRDDKEVVLRAVKNNGKAVLYISYSLLKDPEVILTASKTYPKVFIHLTDDDMDPLKSNWDLALAAVEYDASLFTYLDDLLKKNWQFVYETICRNHCVIMYVDDCFKKDFEICKLAVSLFGYHLADIDESMANNIDIVLTAMRERMDSFMFAGDGIKKNEDALLRILSSYSKVIKYLDKSFLNNPEFIKKAIKVNYRVKNELVKLGLNFNL